MARHLFGPDLLLTAGSSTPPEALLGTDMPFTCWSAYNGGTEYTDLTAPDGVTPLEVDANGKPVADEYGQAPWLRGPDTTGGVEIVVMYRDTGAGVRYPMVAVDVMQVVLQSGALLNLVQHWTAAQYFDGGIFLPNGALPISATLGLQNALDLAGSSSGGLDTEAVQDLVAASLVAGSGISLAYNDTAGTITITGGAAGLDTEAVQDLMGTTIVAGASITTTYNDTAGTITVALNLADGALAIAKTTGLQTALDARVRHDTAAQGLNTTQQANARTNIAVLGAAESELVVEYTGSAWPSSTSTGRSRLFRSTKYSAAPSPTGQVLGDIWQQHPDAP